MCNFVPMVSLKGTAKMTRFKQIPLNIPPHIPWSNKLVAPPQSHTIGWANVGLGLGSFEDFSSCMDIFNIKIAFLKIHNVFNNIIWLEVIFNCQFLIWTET